MPNSKLSQKRHFWLVNIAEPLYIDGKNIRPLRMGMLAEILTARGHRVSWWSCDFLHFEKKHRQIASPIIQFSERLRYLILHARGYRKNVSWQRFQSNRHLAKQYKQWALSEAQQDKPDAIICSLPTIELAYESILLGQKLSIPVAVDLRDMWPDIIADKFPGIFKLLARIALIPQFRKMSFVCKNAAAIFGITPGFVTWGMSYAQRAKTKFDKHFYLAYSKKLAEQVADNESLQFWKNLGLSPECFVTTYLGSLRPQMDIQTIIEAARKLGPQFQFVIAGSGPGLEEYKKASQDLKNVIWPGWVNAPQIRALGEMSDIGIAPYRTTRDFAISIPNKPIEYFAMGLPVVTCLQGELKKFVAANNCGLFYSENSVSELCQQIKSLAENPGKHKEMSQNAKTIFLNNFTSEVIYEDMADTLENLAIQP